MVRAAYAGACFVYSNAKAGLVQAVQHEHAGEACTNEARTEFNVGGCLPLLGARSLSYALVLKPVPG